MKTTLTKSYWQHTTTPSKNRVGIFFGVTSSCTGVIWSQPPETQQETSGISTLLVSDVRNWLSKDPIGISGGLNQYVFVENCPIMYRDPLGLCGDNDDNNKWFFYVYSRSGGSDFPGSSNNNYKKSWGHAWVSVTPPGGKVSPYGSYPKGLENFDKSSTADLIVAYEISKSGSDSFYKFVNKYGNNNWTAVS